MRPIFILRLISALVFAIITAIFALLIPLSGVESELVRLLITIMVALIGFLVFPPLSRQIQFFTIKFFNQVVKRISLELTTQLVKIRHVPTSSTTTLIKPTILDTSAIIDGRVLDIAKTGFVSGLILIPKFVLTELQQVADSSDDLKRSRGRRGFELIEELKSVKGLKIEIWDKDQKGKNVDDKLIELAKGVGGRIVTTDFNLNRVASLSNLVVLNVNDLANAVKTVTIPGEKISVKILHIGKDPKQGVGYLEDGTMVVVIDGASKLGKTVSAEVTKVLQMSAGRMVFGKEVA